MQNDHIHQAIQDLSIIRQAIERSESSTLTDGTPIKHLNFGAHLLVQGLALTMAAMLLGIELCTGANTGAFLASAYSSDLRLGGLANAALLILGAVTALYGILYYTAKREEQSPARFISRNFRYLRNLAFVADLFVKFAVITLVIAAPRPEWVAPVLSLFIGDYLFRGTFFSMRTAPSVGLGIASFAAAYLQFQLQNPNIAWPLSIFVLASAVSLATLYSEKAKAAVSE